MRKRAIVTAAVLVAGLAAFTGAEMTIAAEGPENCLLCASEFSSSCPAQGNAAHRDNQGSFQFMVITPHSWAVCVLPERPSDGARGMRGVPGANRLASRQ